MGQRIAIMQPYFMPYIGYFQLIETVDTFIIYDDVNYIKGGWINRNRVIINNQVAYMNLELSGASPNKKINEICLNQNPHWKKKLIKTIKQSYAKAPYFKEVFPIFEETLSSDEWNLSSFIYQSLMKWMQYLDIKTKLVESSTVYQNQDLKNVERVLDICKQENADTYINPIGGMELYSKEQFAQQGLTLYFIQTDTIPYTQYRDPFVPNLSMLDVLMFNSPESIKLLLKKFELK